MNPYQSQDRWRQLPDGSWYNETADVAYAPLQPILGTGEPKRAPTPGEGPQGPLWRGDPPAADARMIEGLAGNYGAMPGHWGLQMRNGRNYPALGQDPGTSMSSLVKIALLGGVVWVASRFLR